MAHLLIVELPGGNDTDILEAALRQGHTFSFLTQDIYIYKKQANVYRWVEKALDVITSPSFDYTTVEAAVLESHQKFKFDAIIGLLDIRLVETARLAEKLELRYLNVESAKLLRDKFNVRARLKANGIEQPEFELATTNEEVVGAIAKVGLPILMKPSDGYGSQNILILENEEDLDLACETLAHLLPISTDYGLGVRSNDRLLIERYMLGTLIGCDTLTLNGKHHLLGVNEKLMFSPPSFAIRGGCFMPNKGEWAVLEDYLFRILDAVGYDCGATHTEIMLTAEGPRLVEINPRLVGAKIARLMAYSLNKSVHELLIDLHLGVWSIDQLQPDAMKPSVTRWVISKEMGILDQIELPTWKDEGLKCVEMICQKGDRISFPFENSQRLGYVMTCCATREEAELLADRFINNTKVNLRVPN